MSTQASIFKLADVFVSKGLLKERISKNGVRGASLSELKRSVNVAVESLSLGDRNFYNSVRNLRVSKTDIVKKNRLINALTKDNSKLSNSDFVTALNDLFYLSERYGKGAISCSVCNPDDLKLLNISTSIKKVGHPEVRKLLLRVPKKGVKLNRFIKSRLSRQGLDTNIASLSPDDQRVFGLFLNLSEKGPKIYKDFAGAVIAFNKTANKKASLVGRDSVSSIWKLVVDEVSDGDLVKLTAILNKVSKVTPQNREKAFYDELFRLAGDDTKKVNKVRQIKASNCYFK